MAPGRWRRGPNAEIVAKVTGKPKYWVAVVVPRNAPAVTDNRWREADFPELIPLGKPDKPSSCLHSLARSGA